MNPNITKIIDQYLSGTLSPEDKIAFEERLNLNPELQREVELQKDIVEGAKRSAQRLEIKKMGRQYHLKKLVQWSGLSVLVVGAIVSLVLFALNTTPTNPKEIIPDLSQELIEQLNKEQAFDNIEIQYFQIPQTGNVVLSKQGVLLSVPEKAFMLSGTPYSGQVILQYQEAIDAFDIITSGLSTMTGDELLETQGMISVAGYTPDGKKLEFNPEVGIYVQMPVNEYKDGMQLYEGKKLANGLIDWQNPSEFEKIPVPVDMSELDFYPAGYEDKLDELKWKRSKKSRDSLYLSLEFENSYEDATAIEPTEMIEAIAEVENADPVVAFPDQEAEFPGGYTAMMAYINENTEYPRQAREMGISGRVYVSFIVESDGSLSNTFVQRGVHPLLDAEALRLVKNMPNFEPAMQNGIAVRTASRIPIIFTLQGTEVQNPEIANKGRIFRENKGSNSESWANKIQWSTDIQYISETEADLIIGARVLEGWNLNGFNSPTAELQSLTLELFMNGNGYTTAEPEYISQMSVKPFCSETSVTVTDSIRQRIRITSSNNFTIMASVSGTLFNDTKCIQGKSFIQWNSVYGAGKDYAAADEAVADTTESNSGQFILPSKVMAFWNEGFNNTNLSTREFERRMQTIHGTCNNVVLDKYVLQPDKSLSEIDGEVVAMGYSEFQEYADECVGKVTSDNPHVKNLKAFYEKGVEALRSVTKKNLATEKEKQRAFDEHMRKVRSEEQQRSIDRSASYRQQEENFNRANYMRQLNKVNAFTISRGVGPTIWNCDAIRRSRGAIFPKITQTQSGKGTNDTASQEVRWPERKPVEGPKIKPVTYNEFAAKVPNASKYVKLYAYVFPSALNSYQRIPDNNGSFVCRMNDDLIYDVGIVGITEDGYEYFQTMTTKGGDLGNISLEHVSEQKLRASIEQLNSKRLRRPAPITEDLDWLVKERKYYKEQQRRMAMGVFRTTIKNVIFPCYCESGDDQGTFGIGYKGLE